MKYFGVKVRVHSKGFTAYVVARSLWKISVEVWLLHDWK
jgi:hypothetical protein